MIRQALLEAGKWKGKTDSANKYDIEELISRYDTKASFAGQSAGDFSRSSDNNHEIAKELRKYGVKSFKKDNTTITL